MTAHGAKGLEAPIVFLPETTLTQTARGSPLMRVRHDGGDGLPVVHVLGQGLRGDGDAREDRAAREEAEAYRLLYVALTRARDRLVLCGRVAERTDQAKLRGWWGAIRDALAHAEHRRRRAHAGQRRAAVPALRAGPTGAGAEAPSAGAGRRLPAWAARGGAARGLRPLRLALRPGRGRRRAPRPRRWRTRRGWAGSAAAT